MVMQSLTHLQMITHSAYTSSALAFHAEVLLQQAICTIWVIEVEHVVKYCAVSECLEENWLL